MFKRIFLNSSVELDINNLRHGTTTYFFDEENQKIHKTIEYSHGVKHGSEKCYHSTGDLYIEKKYKSGALTDLYYYNNKELLFSKTGINTTKPQVCDNRLERKLILQDKDTNIKINNNAPEDICIAIAAKSNVNYKADISKVKRNR